MLTVRAVYQDGKITLLDDVPFTAQHQVLVTFLDADDEVVFIPRNKDNEIKSTLRRRSKLLSRIELDLLRLAQRGLTVEEMAKQLELARGTTRNYPSRIYSKLGVRNRPEAIKRATELGLIDPTESYLGNS